MKLRSLSLALVTLVASITVAACSSDGGGSSSSGSSSGGSSSGGSSSSSSSSSGSTSTTFTCCINGTYYKCPNQDTLTKCGDISNPDPSGCSQQSGACPSGG